ncbi:GNAT family N-acetyltransferase [Methylobacterium sp. J-067]|uniref:GNAT family N-acetyltransferase n=1 Tax=Methylobacterium sp. J-067 TaxID=2836648 RepID=UPI001FB8D587|nr:GNAT family N-acetyltransferase [Methylobacterium sp. J-067]MCJ2025522.1 GNAT family N-acetyltransferase [Methylobacterium sp. J-067]
MPCTRNDDQASPIVRDGSSSDVAEVLRIYTPYVLYGLATFEEEPPTIEEMGKRREAIVAAGLPYLVAVRSEQVVGYAYATAYRPRPAYRHTVENSVYVTHASHRSGVGTALLGALIDRCVVGPWRQMVAVIGNSANQGSIALHRKAGFAEVGILQAVGFKHGRWVDTVLMQRALGTGSTTGA